LSSPLAGSAEPNSAVTAFIGIGSNLGEPRHQVDRAVAALAQLPQTRLLAVSPWYHSKALGPGPQPDYRNGVAQLATDLPPDQLLAALQAIEHRQGRQRELRWAARTLDLDILLYGDLVVDSATLTIPHPRMAERGFVLRPLLDLAPELILPDGTALAAHLANCATDGIVRVTDGD